jgi:hypothetical protein
MKSPGVLVRECEQYHARRLIPCAVAIAVALFAAACQTGQPSIPAPPQRDLPALALDDSLRPALLAAGRAALDAVLNATKDTAAVCVVFTGPDRREFRPEPADLLALAGSPDQNDSHRRFVSITNCPKTYTSMILTVDAHGHPVDPAPKGYVDPHILSIHLPEQWVPKPDERSITVMVRIAQGTGTDEYLCRVRPSAARAVMLRGDDSNRGLSEAATCRLERQYIS